MDPSTRAISGQLERLRAQAAARHQAYRAVVEATYAAKGLAQGQQASTSTPGKPNA